MAGAHEMDRPAVARRRREHVNLRRGGIDDHDRMAEVVLDARRSAPISTLRLCRAPATRCRGRSGRRPVDRLRPSRRPRRSCRPPSAVALIGSSPSGSPSSATSVRTIAPVDRCRRARRTGWIGRAALLQIRPSPPPPSSMRAATSPSPTGAASAGTGSGASQTASSTVEWATRTRPSWTNAAHRRPVVSRAIDAADTPRSVSPTGKFGSSRNRPVGWRLNRLTRTPFDVDRPGTALTT